MSDGKGQNILKTKEESLSPYQAKNRIRIVSAAALFDGHDAAINVMRRIMQQTGAEVIHLGHNRSVHEIVQAAIQEDVQCVAITSYQGGHNEFFRYLFDQLKEKGAPHIQIFGGGGGVIIPDEIDQLENYGIKKIFSPEDGRRLGLQGMINFLMEQSDFSPVTKDYKIDLKEAQKKWIHLAHLITLIEQGKELSSYLPKTLSNKVPILGFTGTGGSGKSSLVDEFLLRYQQDFPKDRICILSVDPSKRKTGGALLGDRIRMNSIYTPNVFMRSLATRGSSSEVGDSIREALKLVQGLGFDLIVVESSGIGQADTGIVDISDFPIYVMTSEFGAPTQLEKIDMIDFAKAIAINKFDRRGSEDALREVRKQYRRSRPELLENDLESLPVFGTTASKFNDHGVSIFYRYVLNQLGKKLPQTIKLLPKEIHHIEGIIPDKRIRYLSEISESVRTYHKQNDIYSKCAQKLQALKITNEEFVDKELNQKINQRMTELQKEIPKTLLEQLEHWPATCESYQQDFKEIQIRKKTLSFPLFYASLSGLNVPRMALPKYDEWGPLTRFLTRENLSGNFPYTAGVFPFKRHDEDPRRQFAGEGGPDRTNRRFHFLCQNDDAKRLSVAFDSVTLYGMDPHERPDIYGKVGESGVSICCLEDMKRLFKGFDLLHPNTSVSMTINGPAPMILAMFLNTAIDQQMDRFEKEHSKKPNEKEQQKIIDETLKNVRGTVQADILKEDQAQNTCIFSTEFALRMMGDIQAFFTKKKVRNYYSVSISGYHIAEAGANPITQLAFTLANGFTYVEYYLSRGLNIDDFAHNLSFFFSNGLDAEYAVLGRVARRIWAIAMRNLYQANERSQKLKYHIQTSGRSLHAQEISFNDIRTTLQALMAYYDHCNSLHTNAYDEAITTPTEESVRRAMAIQMIIAKELGLGKCDNPLQGSFIIEELTDLVEEAVLVEFDRMSRRGGVLGAMEVQYQRSKIQEESLLYERLKHSGKLPVIGVNTFINPETQDPNYKPPKIELARSNCEEKNQRIKDLKVFHKRNEKQAFIALKKLKEVASGNGNVFEELMKTTQVASLGQISQALYEVGGQYRRSM